MGGMDEVNHPAHRSVQRILVDHAVLHDEVDGFDAPLARLCVEPLRIAAKNGDVFQRIAVDQQDVGIGAFLNDTKRCGVRVTATGQGGKLAASGRHCFQCFIVAKCICEYPFLMVPVVSCGHAIGTHDVD